MKKRYLLHFSAIVLSLFLVACNSNSSSLVTETENTSVDTKAESLTTEETVFFESDKLVNDFFVRYNAIAEIIIPIEEIENGNIRTKALVYIDDFSMEIIHGTNDVLFVSIGTSPNNESTMLYSVFRDSIKAMRENLADDVILTAWDNIHKTGYVVENYELSDIMITYSPYKELSRGISNLRIDLDFPLTN